MTYTARATLEIGSGSVCSGRATTTTTASNQVRTSSRTPCSPRFHRLQRLPAHPPVVTTGPPERLCQIKQKNACRGFSTKPKIYTYRETKWTADETVKNFDIPPNITSTIGDDSQGEKSIDKMEDDNKKVDEGSEIPIMLKDLDQKQCKLLSALYPKTNCDQAGNNGGGSKNNRDKETVLTKWVEKKSRGPKKNKNEKYTQQLKTVEENLEVSAKEDSNIQLDVMEDEWMERVGTWYDGLANYYVERTQEEYTGDENPLMHYQVECDEAKYYAQKGTNSSAWQQDLEKSQYNNRDSKPQNVNFSKISNTSFQNFTSGTTNSLYSKTTSAMNDPITSVNHMKGKSINDNQKKQGGYCYDYNNHNYESDYWTDRTHDTYSVSLDDLHDDELTKSRKYYRARIGNNLIVPKPSSINPKNVRRMTIGKPISFEDDNAHFTLDDRQKDTHTSITKIHDLNTSDVFTNAGKCGNDSEDIGAMEKTSSYLEPVQENIKYVDNKAKTKNYLDSVIFIGSQLKHLDDSKEEANNNVQNIKSLDEIPTCSKEVELTDFQVSHHREDSLKEIEINDFTFRSRDSKLSLINENDFELVDLASQQIKTNSNQVEFKQISGKRRQEGNIRYFADQQKLFKLLEISNVENSDKKHSITLLGNNSEKVQTNLRANQTVAEPVHVKEVNLDICEVSSSETSQIHPPNPEELKIEELSNAQVESLTDVVQITTSAKVSDEQNTTAKQRNTAYIFVTPPETVGSTASSPVLLQIENDNLPEKKARKKIDKSLKKEANNKTQNALKALLFEQLFKVVGKGADANNEVGLPNN